MARKRTSNGQASNRKTSRKRAQGKSLPGWIWGVSGLAIGLFVAFLVHLDNQRTRTGDIDRLLDRSHQEQPASPSGGDNSGGAGEQTGKRDKPRFEFYKLLPQQQVEVPEQESPKAQQGAGTSASHEDETRHETKPSAANRTDTDDNGTYLLQAGSFHDYADADRLKATIALLGVEANIQKVQLAGGETWHRVRIGPFASRDKVNEVRRRLKAHKVDTILLKRGD